MNTSKRLATFFISILMVAIAGCASTSTKEGTGEYIDDSVITTKVKAAIFNAPELKSREINVETFKGTVQLTGFVSSQSDITKAIDVTRSVNGVTADKNEMRIKKLAQHCASKDAQCEQASRIVTVMQIIRLLKATPAPTIPSTADASMQDSQADVAITPGATVALIPPVPRGVALTIIATVALVFALQWAKNFFIPIIFSILISYTLTPVVIWLERIKVPRIVGIGLILLTIFGGTAAVVDSLHTEFQLIAQRLPDAAHQITTAISKAQGGQQSTMQKMQAVATEIEKATAPETGAIPGAKRIPAPIVIARPAFKLQDWLWAGSMSAAEFLGQATMVVFLVFFLLLSGDSFKRKLVKITGPSLTSKKITVNILDDINKSIQSYMFMLLVTNILLGALLWAVFRWIGLENAGAWAVAGACLHIIPYFGPMIIALATGLTAFMQFQSLSKMFLVSGASLLVAVLVGTFITTWMTGRIAKMNAAAVFIGLFFWGWLWGIWGLLLGIPIIVMVRVIAEHIDGWQPVAELLGE